MKDGHPFRETFTSLFRSRMIIHCGFFFFSVSGFRIEAKKKEKRIQRFEKLEDHNPQVIIGEKSLAT